LFSRHVLRPPSAICRGMSGCRGKRLRMSPSDREGSPRRPRRSSRRRTPSAYSLSPSPYRSPSPLPSPSTYRSPSPSPCRSWSQRLPSGVEEDADDRSRSRGSDEIDACGRPLWRPNGYKGAGERGHGDVFSVHIDGFDYDRLFTCKCCRRMLSSPVFQVRSACSSVCFGRTSSLAGLKHIFIITATNSCFL
jgi:E3 ubiquitin-protein ligase SIAH1